MCPHFGLMDPAKMDRGEAALLRSRLHWRGGRRRLHQGKTAAGIVTLYDALLSGMRWFLLAQQKHSGAAPPDEDLENDRYLFSRMEEAGLTGEGVDRAWLEAVADRALRGKVAAGEADGFSRGVETLLRRMAVLPFSEKELPPEDPQTF